MIRPLNKADAVKRHAAISKLLEYLELRPRVSLGVIFSELMSPLGYTKLPYRWTDAEFQGVLETAIKRIEDGTDEED